MKGLVDGQILRRASGGGKRKNSNNLKKSPIVGSGEAKNNQRAATPYLPNIL